MNSSRSDFGQRLILPLVLLHLIYAVLFLFIFRAITPEASLVAWFLITGCALAYGKIAGLLSGLSLAIVQSLGLAFIRFQDGLPTQAGSILNNAAFPAAAASLTGSLAKLADFPAFMMVSVRPALILMPAFGFLIGLYAERFGIRNPKHDHRLRALDGDNQSLRTHNVKLEGAIQNLTQEPVYHREWATLFGQHPLNEQLVGILLASVTAGGWLPNMQSGGQSRTVQWAPSATRRLFETLRQVRPDVLAVMSLNGRILCGSETLFAIYGYPTAADFENASILDLLLPDDAGRATGAIERALTRGLSHDDCYGVRPPDRMTLALPDALASLAVDKNSLQARFGPSVGTTSGSAAGNFGRRSADGTADFGAAGNAVGESAAGNAKPNALGSQAGGFRQLLVSPQIVLELAGNPLSLVACISSQTFNNSAYATEPAPIPDQLLVPEPAHGPNYAPGHAHDTFGGKPSATGQVAVQTLASLTDRSLCCLFPDGRIYYLSPALTALFGKSAEAMLGKRFDRFVSRKHADRYETLRQGFLQGRYMSLEIEMLPHDGRRRIFRIEAYPSIDANSRCLGCTLLLDDISSVRLVEEALQHRLSMEKMISSISTRFISIQAADLDREITQVLQMLGDFEQTEESHVEIYQSTRIRQPAVYSIIGTAAAAKPAPDSDHSRDRQQDIERFETISIPIVIESESVGHFSFLQECYHDSWFETDLELIRLIGEIIINGLIRKENELDIKLNETRLATTIHSIGEGVIATDTDGRIILMNQMAETLTGWSRERALHQPLDCVFQPSVPVPAATESQYVSTMHPLSETDASVLLASLDGHQYFIQSSRSLIRDQHAVYGEVTVFRDVTQEKIENDEIRYVSYHDKLTGLYNRAFFEEELIRLNTQRQYPITLIIGDCNGLKIANDIFGHLEGDKLLQTIARILRKATRHEDIVARWGGDEFTIILPKTDETAGALICERILQLCVEAPFDPIQPSLALGSATNTEADLADDDLVGVLKLAEDRMYRHKLMEGRSTRNTLLLSIERMIYEKSYETEEHASRLKEVSMKLGRAVGLSAFEQEELSLLSVLHDIGKIGIPDQILTKPERLSNEEWAIMRKHAEKGYNLAKSTPELASIADSILHHHERWDGCGYPAGLHGEEIPKLSRILSIIDAYDVITHARAYKLAQSKPDALREIERCAGTQFDPELTRIFIDIMKQE